MCQQSLFESGRCVSAGLFDCMRAAVMAVAQSASVIGVELNRMS